MSYFVPVGSRCASVEIAQKIISQPRFPFDWCQMNVWSMKKVIELEQDYSKEFWSMYFSELDDTKHHTKTQSWFPHDSFSTNIEMNMTVEKYVRRTERLLQILESPTNKVFLIVFGFPEESSSEATNILYHALKAKAKGNNLFLVCNAAILEEDKEIDNMYFFYIKLQSHSESDIQNWNTFIEEASLKVKFILNKKGISICPFERHLQ